LLCMCEEREERPKEHQKTREKGQQKTCHKMMMAQRCVKEKEKQARERERETRGRSHASSGRKSITPRYQI